ncbi:glycosyltransferase [Desulfovibrio sp. ZJ369]|uniref:glycosyltransferase family 2 protein n=1 Tax=Desulfovibrio sp. ZJ369 TaxID=2709793 RepID=UPI00198018ED|nr:glycosyltransferase [Desulfovibrio sp. ZJ369]
MPRMLVFFGTPGSGYEELAWLLHINSAALEKAGWIYFAEDYSWSPAYPRIPSSARMFEIFKNACKGRPNARKEMFAYLKKLNAVLELGNDVLLSGGFPNFSALQKFLNTGKGFSAIAHAAIEVKLLLGRPDRSIDFLYRQYLFRDVPNLLEYMKNTVDYDAFHNPEQIAADFSGVPEVNIWLHRDSDPTILVKEHKKVLCELLHIDQFDNNAEKLMPKSIAGFEILYALRTIQIYTNSWPEDILAAIRKMEENLGLPWQPLCQASGNKFKVPDYASITPQIAGEFARHLDTTEKKAVIRHLYREQQIPADVKKTLLEALSPGAPEYVFCKSASKPKISVLTLSHNHVRYIAQNIESVIAQKTDATLEHIILDDASDDGTQAVIESYASRYPHIRPIYLRKRAGHGENVRELFAACNSEYAALCDGDDYFSDANKLHKQMEFLDQYKECALCFHRVDVLYEDGSPSRAYPPEDMLPRGLRPFYHIQDLLQGNFIQTNSVMYRWRFREGLPEWFDPTLIPGDWYWHLLHAETGLIGYMRDHMAVYRRHETSMYASADINHVFHRKLWGLNELRTYAALDEHFNGNYHADLQKLANGVFADFLRVYLESGDDSLLQQGCQTFPMFGRDFLAALKIGKNREVLV